MSAYTVTVLSFLPYTVTVVVCLSISVVTCSLSPSMAVVVTVFILPVKDEAEAASLIQVLWREAVVRSEREGESEKVGERDSNQILDCKKSQAVYTLVCLR